MAEVGFTGAKLNGEPESGDPGLSDTESRDPELRDVKLREAGGPPPLHAAHPPRNTAIDRMFLEPEGVRSGWRAAFYVALFLLFLLGLQLLALLSHVRLVTRASMITPSTLAIQEF